MTRALSIALLLAGLTIAVLAMRLSTARADLAIATHDGTVTSGQLTACQAANATEHGNVLTLTAKLAAAVGQNQAIEQAKAEADTAADKAAAERDAALAALQRQRSATYASDPDAHAWNPRALPVAVSDGLRDQWAAARADRAFGAD